MGSKLRDVNWPELGNVDGGRNSRSLVLTVVGVCSSPVLIVPLLLFYVVDGCRLLLLTTVASCNYI